MLPSKAYLPRGNTMLDLIEISNFEVLGLMGLAASMGFVFGIVLLYMPLRAKYDTLVRKDQIREYLS